MSWSRTRASELTSRLGRAGRRRRGLHRRAGGFARPLRRARLALDVYAMPRVETSSCFLPSTAAGGFPPSSHRRPCLALFLRTAMDHLHIPKTGINIPNMGMADALCSRTQQRVLGLLFGQPDRRFGTVELIKLAGSGSGAVQRELERLSTSGLVTSTVAGRQRGYQANRASPIFGELSGLVEKISGVPDVLREALVEIQPKIMFAFLYGSVAKELDTVGCVIDVLVVSDALRLEELYGALQAAEARLARRSSPTFNSSAEYRKRRRAKHPFLAKVMAGMRVTLVGTEDAVGTSR